MRPGDRKQRWQSTCTIEGIILFLIGLFFAYSGLMAPRNGWIVLLIALGALWGSMKSFTDAKRGWKMTDKRPPWADRHDAIDRGDLTLYKRYPHWRPNIQSNKVLNSKPTKAGGVN